MSEYCMPELDGDRLAIIKVYREETGYASEDEIDWLMAEVERLRKMQPIANVTLSDDAKHFEGLAKKAEAENAELQAVFDLQETRTKKAEKMWQQATGKHNTLPDLGVLLDWLMGEVKHQKSVSQIWYDSDKRQRRHRKWALKKARSYLHNPCATVVYAGGEGRIRVMEDKDE